MHPTQNLPGTRQDPTGGTPSEPGYTSWLDRRGMTVEVVSSACTLREAAGYLTRYGWVQGCYYDLTSVSFKPATCLVGALGVVCYGGPVDAPAQQFDHPGFPTFEAAFAHLDGFLVHTYDLDVYSFNDARYRTAEQVVAALHAAADSDPATWVPHCCGTRMVEDTPAVTVFDRTRDEFEADRVYTCPRCHTERSEYVMDPADRARIFADWCGMVDGLPHDGTPHTPGTSTDCDTCEAYCFCTEQRVCMHHTPDTDEWGDAPWDVPGQAPLCLDTSGVGGAA